MVAKKFCIEKALKNSVDANAMDANNNKQAKSAKKTQLLRGITNIDINIIIS